MILQELIRSDMGVQYHSVRAEAVASAPFGLGVPLVGGNHGRHDVPDYPCSSCGEEPGKGADRGGGSTQSNVEVEGGSRHWPESLGRLSMVNGSIQVRRPAADTSMRASTGWTPSLVIR